MELLADKDAAFFLIWTHPAVRISLTMVMWPAPLNFLTIHCNPKEPGRSIHIPSPPCRPSCLQLTIHLMLYLCPDMPQVIFHFPFLEVSHFHRMELYAQKTEMWRWTALTLDFIDTELSDHIQLKTKNSILAPFFKHTKLDTKREKCQRWQLAIKNVSLYHFLVPKVKSKDIQHRFRCSQQPWKYMAGEGIYKCNEYTIGL